MDETVPPTPRPRRRTSEPGTTGTTDTPPRKSSPAGAESAGGARPQAPRPPAGGRKAPLQKSLEELFAAPSLAYSIAGDQVAASFLASRAEPMAEAWYNLSKESPAVRRILDKLTTGSAWGGVVIATGATVLPLLAHHDVLPFDLPFGIPVPEGEEGASMVPPPPPPSGPPPAPDGRGRAGGGTTPPNGMTPPRKAGEPAGVVTVAGSNSQAR